MRRHPALQRQERDGVEDGRVILVPGDAAAIERHDRVDGVGLDFVPDDVGQNFLLPTQIRIVPQLGVSQQHDVLLLKAEHFDGLVKLLFAYSASTSVVAVGEAQQVDVLAVAALKEAPQRGREEHRLVVRVRRDQQNFSRLRNSFLDRIRFECEDEDVKGEAEAQEPQQDGRQGFHRLQSIF